MIGSSVSEISATTAHREWATRPPDERYTSVQALYEAARARRQHLDARIVDTGTFRTEAVEDDLVIRETSGRTAPLTRAVSADILHFSARVVVTATDPFVGGTASFC